MSHRIASECDMVTMVQGGEMDCGPTCVRILTKAISGTDLGKALCDEASELLPGRCVETRQLALALGRLLSPEHTRISFCFLFTEAWGFDFYQRFKAELQEDRRESMLRFYQEAAKLDLSAESRSVSLEEIRSFFAPQADYEFPEFSCRAAIVLLDWSVVASFLTESGKGVKLENIELSSNYFGHFCVLINIKGDEAFLIDPSSEDGSEKFRSHPVKGGCLRRLPLKVFEAARRSPGTDEDVVMVSWLPEPNISYLREKASWQLPDALLSACYQGKSRMVLDLLKSAASSEVRKLRTTPLIVASWRGHADVAGVLLERRANPNEAEPTTALWFAAEGGHMEVLRVLLRYRGSVNITDSAGRSPLWAASKHGHLLVAKQLLLEGSNVEIDDSVEGTALSVAAERGHKELVRLLLEWRAAVDMVNGQGATPLLIAAEAGHSEVLLAFLRRGEETSSNGSMSLLAARNRKEATALHLAAERGHLTAAELLLTWRAEVDAGNLHDASPLMLAAEGGFEDVVDLLIRHGAAVNKRNKEGSTALTLARHYRHRKVASLLEATSEPRNKK